MKSFSHRIEHESINISTVAFDFRIPVETGVKYENACIYNTYILASILSAKDRTVRRSNDFDSSSNILQRD